MLRMLLVLVCSNVSAQCALLGSTLQVHCLLEFAMGLLPSGRPAFMLLHMQAFGMCQGKQCVG